MKYLIFLAALSISIPAIASPLDLIASAPGSFWGKVDGSPTTDADHIQFDAEQGVQFKHITWITWYLSVVLWQQTGVARSSYWAYGAKNSTLIPHFTLGIEEENYVFSEPTVATNALVGYVSCNFDWNLKRTD